MYSFYFCRHSFSSWFWSVEWFKYSTLDFVTIFWSAFLLYEIMYRGLGTWQSSPLDLYTLLLTSSKLRGKQGTDDTKTLNAVCASPSSSTEIKQVMTKKWCFQKEELYKSAERLWMLVWCCRHKSWCSVSVLSGHCFFGLIVRLPAVPPHNGFKCFRTSVVCLFVFFFF